jgi:hypothetical protein
MEESLGEQQNGGEEEFSRELGVRTRLLIQSPDCYAPYGNSSVLLPPSVPLFPWLESGKGWATFLKSFPGYYMSCGVGAGSVHTVLM